MNLLNAIAPYSKHIDAFEKGFGITDIPVYNKLVDIWNEFKIIPANAEAIYGNPNMKAPKTPYGCPTCGEGESMMKSIVNWRKKLIREGHSADLEFKGDADQPTMAKVDEPKKKPAKEKKVDAPKAEAEPVKTEEAKSESTGNEPAASTGEAKKEEAPAADDDLSIDKKLQALKMGPLKTIAKDLGAPYSKTTTKPQIIAAIMEAGKGKTITFPTETK